MDWWRLITAWRICPALLLLVFVGLSVLLEWTSTGGEPNSKTFSEMVEMFLLEEEAGLAMRLVWSAYLRKIGRNI